MKCVMDLWLHSIEYVLRHQMKSNHVMMIFLSLRTLRLIKNIRFIKKTYQNVISRIFSYLFQITFAKRKIKNKHIVKENQARLGCLIESIQLLCEGLKELSKRVYHLNLQWWITKRYDLYSKNIDDYMIRFC